MKPVRIGVLASGGGSNLQSLLDNVHGKYGEVVLVASNIKDAYALERAKKSGVASAFIEKEEYDKNLEELLEKESVELIVLAGYLKKISPSLVKRYENRILNIHPSLIPSFCGEGAYGIHVHEKALDYGVKISGATVHFVDEEMDTGPIVLQEAVRVEDDDTPETLQKRVLKVEHKLLPMAVIAYCQGRLKVVGRKVFMEKGGEDESTDQCIG